ncbi:phosphatidylserine decarboxylase [Aulographum hederae CBS 113979]|uniref:Phosphatidylserine decarboxylase n=1 Tax=Aulographum hederae CBS 113979 TaxID=1176131 RepID=A0A6G1GQS0_9PEZI|nr:phosphatidylserine decarboxylase [Aulographum hederae CBS 113979]
MGFWDTIHGILDYLFTFVRLAQNREVGWLSLDRKSGKIMREQEPILKKIKLLLLFNPVTEWIDTTHAMRLHIHRKSTSAGKQEAGRSSKMQIKPFIDFYHINMKDFEPSDPDAYSNFEDFFVRHHTAASRPTHEPDNPKNAVVVADSRVVTYPTVSQVKKLWIKGHDFSITNLDYHRYHSPVSGTVKLFRSMPGDYYQVDPVALGNHVDILTRNARDYVVIDTEEFGEVLFVAIGATDVGTVEIHEKWRTPGAEIKKGEEIGLFQFGDSSIIVAFQKGRLRFDDDLLEASEKRVQVAVEVGMSLGTAVGGKKDM